MCHPATPSLCFGINCVFLGASIMVSWVKFAPVELTFQMDAGPSPDYSTSDPVPCLVAWEGSVRWLKSLGPCSNAEDQKEKL